MCPPAVGYTPPTPTHPASPHLHLVSTPGRFLPAPPPVLLIQQQVDEAMGPLPNPDTRRSKTSPTRRRGC